MRYTLMTALCTLLLAGCPAPDSVRDGTGGPTAPDGGTGLDQARADVPVEAIKTAARAARSSGDLKRAVRYWQRVITAAPTPEHALGYARVLRARGDGEQAYIVLDDHRPDSPSVDYLAELGKAALAAGYPKRAIETLDAAVAQAPERALLRSVKAIAVARLGRREAALTAARMAADDADERSFAPGLNLALLQAQAGRIEAAKATLAELSGEPGTPPPIDRARALLQLIAGDGGQATGETLSPEARRRLRRWLTGQAAPPDDTAAADPGDPATWYVRVTAADAHRIVLEALQERRPEASAPRAPVRIRHDAAAAAADQTVVLAPVRGWRSARRVCRDVRASGAACQLGHRAQVAGGDR